MSIDPSLTQEVDPLTDLITIGITLTDKKTGKVKGIGNSSVINFLRDSRFISILTGIARTGDFTVTLGEPHVAPGDDASEKEVAKTEKRVRFFDDFIGEAVKEAESVEASLKGGGPGILAGAGVTVIRGGENVLDMLRSVLGTSEPTGDSDQGDEPLKA